MKKPDDLVVNGKVIAKVVRGGKFRIMQRTGGLFESGYLREWLKRFSAWILNGAPK